MDAAAAARGEARRGASGRAGALVPSRLPVDRGAAGTQRPDLSPGRVPGRRAIAPRPRLLPGAYGALGARAAAAASCTGHATNGTLPRPQRRPGPARRAPVTSGRPAPGPGCGSRKNAWPAEGGGGAALPAPGPGRRGGSVPPPSPGARRGRGGLAGGSGGAPERPLTKAQRARPPSRTLRSAVWRAHARGRGPRPGTTRAGLRAGQEGGQALPAHRDPCQPLGALLLLNLPTGDCGLAF